VTVQDREDQWFSLIDRMKTGSVIPVVGPDLLVLSTVGDATSNYQETLYSVVGRKLAEAAKLSPEITSAATASSWPLFACVSQCLIKEPGSADRLRRKVAHLIDEVIPQGIVVPRALMQLASIEAFSLFVSLTCDDLLSRAIKARDPNAYQRAFAIRSGTAETSLDIPAPPPRCGVYQLLGSADNLLDFAIHDGDAVEYLYRLHSEHGRSVRILLGELRKRDLLLIGCRLPDWFGRSLLRLVNSEPLISKSTHEFLCDDAADLNLTTFISRFSPNSLLFEGSAEAFVEELLGRWQRESPQPPARLTPDRVPLHSEGATVFISYASEDCDAAHSLAKELLDIGAGDVWFDKRKLRAGDDWSERIKEAIHEHCDFFMPVLSSQADERREGVYWEEWQIAIERSHRIPEGFLLPTCIDAEPNAYKSYNRIGRLGGTALFLTKHVSHAPNGVFDSASRESLRLLFQNFRR